MNSERSLLSHILASPLPVTAVPGTVVCRGPEFPVPSDSSPKCARRHDTGNVILVLGALPRQDVGIDVVPPVAWDARRWRGVAWNIIGAWIAIVPMEVVRCYVRVSVALVILQGDVKACISQCIEACILGDLLHDCDMMALT